MIDVKTLRQLIKLMKDNDLSELDLRDKDEQVLLKRGAGGAVQQVAPPAVAPVQAAPAPAQAAGGEAPAESKEKTAAEQGLIEIKSPMVGTFYNAPSPDADPYVKVGANVDDETVVCIVEAMKVFNEIKAETKGTIEKVLVSTGQSVEYGQPIFLVKPN